MMPENADHILTELVTRVARVRKRLVALVLLRSLALIFLSLSVYILLFAWLDHRSHFSTGARCVGLLLLVGLTVGLLLVFLRRLSVSLGLAHAASHVESARHYHQQLLAALEYFQQRGHYPYSETLARRMICQLWAEAKDDDFSASVPVWKLWVYASVVTLGLVVVGLFVRQHYAFLARYVARLGQPYAALEPLPATRLRSLSGDMTVECNETVDLEAAIEGRIPQTGKLIIQTRVKQPPGADSHALPIEASYDPVKVLSLQPVEGTSDESPRFQGRYSFAKTGLYRYCFTAADAETAWHEIRVCVFPEIASITAELSLDMGTRQLTTQETVTDFVLSALAGSQAEITVTASCPLERAEVGHLDGRTESYHVKGSDDFSFTTLLDRDGRIAFRLQDTEGLWSRELPPLTIKIKEDTAPQFSLLHPQGDSLATNVASVPIRFIAKDDFGITDANLFLDLGNGRTECIPAVISDDGRMASIDYVLELEQYGLDIDDAVLFHARATDMATGSPPRARSARSDVVMLEIKPYRRIWLQGADGPPRPG